MSLADQILPFLSQLQLPVKPPKGVQVLNPYKNPITLELCKQFYHTYYGDDQPRALILGINPGRFGGGVTGIPFTDPIQLEKECGIKNALQKKPELSAEYMYQMIRAYGGPVKFYQHFYISSVCPLGFTKDSKNLNYYDHPPLEKKVTPFIINSLNKQLRFGFRRDICFCLGESNNYEFLAQLNVRHRFFEKIIPLAHPRFIMQYRRRKVREYIDDYLSKFGSISAGNQRSVVSDR